MRNIFEKLTNKKIILLSLGLVLLMALVTLLYVYKIVNETIFTIVIFLLLITFSTFTSTLFQRHLTKKMDEKKKGKKYTITKSLAFDIPFKELKANFGSVSLYLENKVLYSLVKVDDPDLFFSEEQQQVKYNIDKKKYNKMIQFYLFDVKDYNLFKKISIINYQSKNFYVGSFIVDNDNKIIYQSDAVPTNDEYKEVYNNFLKLLGLDQE